MVLTIHASDIATMLWDRNAAGDDMSKDMNERIEGLWWKARIGYNNQNCDPEVIEKFAELIVQECLNEIQSLLDCNTQVDEFEQGVYNGIDMAKDCIKEHFGVEE